MRLTPRLRVSSPRRLRFIELLMLAALATPIEAGSLAEWPTLRPGMWETSRTIDGADETGRAQPQTRRECIDPVDVLKQEHARLASLGCNVTPPTRLENSNSYTYSSTCLATGAPTSSRTTITVQSADGYREVTESTLNGATSKATTVARRLGSCHE